MTKSNNSKKKLITLKIYFDRARMYLGYINFFILNMVLIESIENASLKEYIAQYKWVLIPLLFFSYVSLLLLIGYLDHKMGLRQEELRNNAIKNPVMQDLISSIKDIQNKLIKIELNTSSNSSAEVYTHTNKKHINH